MEKRQKIIVIKFAAVLVVVAIAFVAMIIGKDFINRSEATVAMKSLGMQIRQYRQSHNLLPSQSWVNALKEDLPGSPRLGDLHYRGLWIDFESTPDEILAYTQKDYRSPLLGKGYLVLRLGAIEKDEINIEWMDKQVFEKLLLRQQRQGEAEALRKHLTDPKTQ
jgi:type II secretory pathway pseudopilin PulG